jgi:hypothetical protein
MKLRPIVFDRAHHRAAATRFCGRYARVEAASMAEAYLRSRPRVNLGAGARATGVNAESTK